MTITRGRISHPAVRARRSLHPEAGICSKRLLVLLRLVSCGLKACSLSGFGPTPGLLTASGQAEQPACVAKVGCSWHCYLMKLRNSLAGAGGEGQRARTVTQTTRVSAVSGAGEGQCAAEEQGGRLPPPTPRPMHTRSMATVIATCRHNDSSRYAVYKFELIQAPYQPLT